MTVTREEAKAALAEVEGAQRRSSILSRYAGGGPIMMLWGLVWFVCNLTSQFAPAAVSNWTWMVADAAGVLATVLMARRAGRGGGWRPLGVGFGFAAFLFCLFALLRPTEPQQVNGAISLAAALAYMLLGMAGGARFAWLGLILAAAVTIGFFLFHAWFFAWMAVVGGGALFLGGLWLRGA